MVIVLVFIAALVLVSGGGYAVVSRVRARKQRALKASIDELMFGDEKPEVRVIGKRKPLPEAQAQSMRVQLPQDFDAFVVAWGTYCRALKPYDAAEETQSEARGRINGLEFPLIDEVAIDRYLVKMQDATRVVVVTQSEKESCLPLVYQTAREFHAAFKKLVGTLVALKDLDRQFVIPDDLYEQTLRAEVVANSARRHAGQAEKHSQRGGEEEPTRSVQPISDAEAAARLETLRKQQLEMIASSHELSAAIETALETGKEVKELKLEYKEPEKPEAAAVDAFIDAIADWQRLTLSTGRAHNAALVAIETARQAVISSTRAAIINKTPGDPIEVTAAIDATYTIKRLVEKRLSESGERIKQVASKTSVDEEVTSPPTGELKNLLPALRSQVRAYAMALGAKVHAANRYNELYRSQPTGPDITSAPVADPADVARTMRLLEEWSRGCLKHEETVNRASAESKRREEQFAEARKKLTETTGKVETDKLPDDLLTIWNVALKMLEIQRSKEYRPSYGGW